MGLLTNITDALVGFVRRNPLTVVVILLLALGAPSLLKGITIFILYAIMGFALLVIGLMIYFRWRIRRVQRQMEERFGQGGFGPRGFGGAPFGGTPPRGGARREGDVEVRRTADAPEKRVSSDVGDYVEFEETKE